MGHVSSFLEQWDRSRSLALDFISFGFVNLLQARHPLPENFRQIWDEFNLHWKNREVAEFYQIPENFARPELPPKGRLIFETPYPGDYPTNNRAAFDFYPCAEGWTAPTMLIAHGLMSVSNIGYKMWAQKLNNRGWNAVFVHLPFHYSRRTPGHFHGELCFTGDLLRSALAIRQSVVECRVVLQTLAAQGGQLFGAWGTSYGGWMMSLLGCMEPLLQRLLLVEPILNVDKALWELPSSVGLRRSLRKLKITPADTADSMRLVCPLWQKPQMEGRHIILIAGKYDRIACPEQIEELHQLWAGSHYACFRQGHVGYTLMPESFRMAQKLWPEDFQLKGSSD